MAVPVTTRSSWLLLRMLTGNTHTDKHSDTNSRAEAVCNEGSTRETPLQIRLLQQLANGLHPHNLFPPTHRNEKSATSKMQQHGGCNTETMDALVHEWIAEGGDPGFYCELLDALR